jgi:hypothetical protein
LLATVGGQLARNRARKPTEETRGNLPAFVAPDLDHRLHAFDYLSGVMTGASGAHVWRSLDAYALAYLDGTVGYMNAAMLLLPA